MEIKFSKEQAEKIIQAYYQIHESKEVQVSSKATSGCEGIYEIPCTDVTFMVSGTETLFGESIAVDENLTKKQVEGILTTMLSDEGYSVESISYDAGTTTGDFFDRGTRTYFHGINVQATKKVDQKVKKIG